MQHRIELLVGDQNYDDLHQAFVERNTLPLSTGDSEANEEGAVLADVAREWQAQRQQLAECWALLRQVAFRIREPDGIIQQDAYRLLKAHGQET